MRLEVGEGDTGEGVSGVGGSFELEDRVHRQHFERSGGYDCRLDIWLRAL